MFIQLKYEDQFGNGAVIAEGDDSIAFPSVGDELHHYDTTVVERV
jgi:hypothetical protein